MAHRLTRRQLLQQLGATAGAAMLPLGVIRGQSVPIMVAGKAVEIAVFSVSPDTAPDIGTGGRRLTVDL